MTAYLDRYGDVTTALAPVIVVALALFGIAVLAFNGGIVAWVLIDQALLRIRRPRPSASLDDLMDGDDWATTNGVLDEQSETWLFEAPEFQVPDADRTEKVLFAASVLADIDDWTDGGDAA